MEFAHVAFDLEYIQAVYTYLNSRSNLNLALWHNVI